MTVVMGHGDSCVMNVLVVLIDCICNDSPINFGGLMYHEHCISCVIVMIDDCILSCIWQLCVISCIAF